MNFDQLLNALDVNTEELLARFCGNKSLLERFVGKFPKEKTYMEFKEAFLSNHTEEQETAIHTLKGIAANLGFEQLYLCCSNFLEDFRGPKVHLNENFAAVCSEYERLVQLIESYSPA